MVGFQDYQAAFTASLRRPTHCAPPRGTDRRRMRVYQQIVFNQFFGSVSACFPVLTSILGKHKFRRLVRLCFSQHRFTNPLFQSIPASFVDFLNANPTPDLPPYTAALAHYEWLELALSRESAEQAMTSQVQALESPTLEPTLSMQVRLPAVYRLQQYAFPVHQLSRKQPDLPASETYLLVYRTRDMQIRFIQLNALTYQLLQHIHARTATAEQHLRHLSTFLPDLPIDTLLAFGLQTLRSLASQQAIIFMPQHR